MLKASTIVGTPKPMYFVVPIKYTTRASTAPPITGRRGGYFILLLKRSLQK